MKHLLLFFWLILFSIQLHTQPAESKEGYVNVEGGKIWYKMAGRFDEARPETMYMFCNRSENARVVIIEESGHASIFDQPETVIKTVREFLNQVENP